MHGRRQSGLGRGELEPVVGGRTVLGVVYMRQSITAGHDQCDARSDRRRPCIRVGASKVGGGVAVMKCGLAGRP